MLEPAEKEGQNMGRAAGDSDYYTLSVVDSIGRPVGRPRHLTSVTTILDAMPKYLAWWGFRLGLDAGRKLGPALDGGTEALGYEALTEEQFYEAAKAKGREGLVKTPSNVLTDAADRGTTIHDLAEKTLSGSVVLEAPPGLEGYAAALASWWEEYQPYVKEVLLLEEPVYSLKHEYAGTLDTILHLEDGLMDSEYMVLDFKTSKAIYSNHLLQPVAYAEAAIEMGVIPAGVPVAKRVVAFHADGKYEVADSPFSIEEFLDVKKMWTWLTAAEKNKPKKRREVKAK